MRDESTIHEMHMDAEDAEDSLDEEALELKRQELLRQLQECEEKEFVVSPTLKKPKLEFGEEKVAVSCPSFTDDISEISRCPMQGINIKTENSSFTDANKKDNADDDFDDLELLEQLEEKNEQENTILKRVPLYRRADIIEPLPEGWREVTHKSGMPVFLHQATRICTLSRPYYLGRGSVRMHLVPQCAIPCLQEREINRIVDTKKAEAKKAGSALPCSDIVVQLQDGGLNKELSSDELYDYVKPLFRFQMLRLHKNRREWRQRLEYGKEEKELINKRIVEASQEANLLEDEDGSKNVQRCVMPGAVLINMNTALMRGGKPGRQRTVQVAGKSAVNILHDYSSKFLKGTKPEYVEEEGVRSAATPYQIAVYLKLTTEARLCLSDSIQEKLAVLKEREKFCNGVATIDPTVRGDFLGRGIGSSKKEAKRLAAQDAVKLLFHPNKVEFNANGEAYLEKETESRADIIEEAAENVFESIPIDDRRVPNLAPSAAVPTPLDLLKLHLQRTAALTTMRPEWKTEKISHHRVGVTLKLGELIISDEAGRRSLAEQYCAQKALRHFHPPEIKSYGALLKIYAQNLRDQYQGVCQQREVTKLQSSQRPSEGNTTVLEKLRSEMRILADAAQRRAHGLCATNIPVL